MNAQDKIMEALDQALMQLAEARGYVMLPEVRTKIQEAQNGLVDAKALIRSDERLFPGGWFPSKNEW
jgi:hypothetical protein